MDRTPAQASIVVGLGGYPHDRNVLTAALRQAAYSGARLHVVRALGLFGVLEDTEPEVPLREQPAAGTADAVAVRRRVQWQVEQVAAVVAPGVEVDYEVRRGDPATNLLAAAADGGTMIVLGTRNDDSMPALMLGKVSQDVAVHADCLVLLVPPPERPRRG
ncbi:universal stress protein [Planosporangium sp. 12N6]|uniref:universal stress protein n=1 Tax=Planosporangium spinosum TaxID=3402278 RepID=UPI003CF79CFA